MAIIITDECINCGACEPECPNNAIYEGGAEWRYSDGTSLTGMITTLDGEDTMADDAKEPVDMDVYYIVSDKCTECVGFHDEPQCAAVCPVDCCVDDPDFRESEDELLAKKDFMHLQSLKKLLFLFFFLFLPQLFAFAQSDTVSIVSYNLLNFPEGRTDCGNNTLVPNRADTLRKVLNYLKPDIFVACEIQTEAGADSVLTRSLNVQGQTNYASATYNVAGLNQGLNNQLYYNTTKLTLLYQDIIQTSPRSIDHYVLYMNDPNLSSYFDTTFIEVYMCHLKAGSGSSEQNIRAQQVQELVDFIQVRPSDRHHIVCGDLNVYRSSEQAYQLLLNAGVGLIDPINRPGNWNNNASFADIHTQSTLSLIHI